MRISTDPKDPAFVDARPRRVWCNDVLIEGWIVADEFRRVVITPDKVHHGSVMIEQLPENGEPPSPPPSAPISGSFSGMVEAVPVVTAKKHKYR
jgi:hypothetical protein